MPDNLFQDGTTEQTGNILYTLMAVLAGFALGASPDDSPLKCHIQHESNLFDIQIG
jgi:hypothetical protein